MLITFGALKSVSTRSKTINLLVFRVTKKQKEARRHAHTSKKGRSFDGLQVAFLVKKNVFLYFGEENGLSDGEARKSFRSFLLGTDIRGDCT